VKRGEASLTLFIEWSTTLFGKSTAFGTLVASTLGKILSEVLASHSDTLLGELDYLSRATLDQITAWNGTHSAQPVERCIHGVIADRVGETPNAEAVCAWDGSFTYRELDAVAHCLATRLVQLGVGPEVLVPLCFDKSVCRLVPTCRSVTDSMIRNGR
jgi:non-ribosomal peptide synthetase component F